MDGGSPVGGGARRPGRVLTTAGVRLVQVHASDALGHWYAQASPIARSAAGALVVVDSTAIERWPIGATDHRDTVAFVVWAIPPGSRVVHGTVIFPPGRQRAFSARVQWAVARDGRVAVVSPSPFQVRLVRPDGTRVSGPSLAYQPVPISDGLEQQWREAWRRLRGRTYYVTSNGASGRRPAPADPPDPVWPEVLPPFVSEWTRPEPVRFDERGRLWIERATAVDRLPAWDIVNARGDRVVRVRLPVGRRIVGFGPEALYAVHRDEVDVEHLERYRLPAGRGPSWP